MPIFFPPIAARRRLSKATLAACLTLLLGACASVPPPDNSMNLAQTRLQEARDAGAADYAPVDLGFAQDKFQQAQAAMADRQYAAAADLSEESRADAELARAKARLGAVHADIRKKLDENSALRKRGENLGSPAAAAASTVDTTPSGEMPAPDASVLSAPADSGFQTLPASGHRGSGGFQTVPDQPAPATSSSYPPSGGQP